jgi:hypothetical protein
MALKTFSMQNYINNAEFYANFETVEKNAKNLLTKKLWAKKCAKLEFVLFNTKLTCKGFWQITFSRYTFFQLFPRIRNQRKILRILILKCKKRNQSLFQGYF